MSSDLWRWADPHGQQRKVRLDELRASLAAGLIAPNAPVWRDGFVAWQPANEVAELTSASASGANGVILNIPPPPLAMVAVQQEYEAKSGSIAPLPVAEPADVEPPPPPPYVPLPVKSPSLPPSSQMKTQVGGSAHVPVPASTRLGPSLPTSIGLPRQDAVKRSVPPPAPPAKPSRMVEELSDSALEETTTPDLPPAVPAPSNGAAPTADGFPAPTTPVLREDVPSLFDGEVPGLQRRSVLKLLRDDIDEIRAGRPPQNKLLIAVVGVVGLSLVIMTIAAVASIGSDTPRKTAATTGSASAVASMPPPSTTAPSPSLATMTTATAASAATSAAVEEPKSTARECTAAGDARTIAPRATIGSGLEAHALGNALALGFASSPRDAVATSLDPGSLVPMATVRTRPNGGDARRVTPMLVGGKLTAIPDVERKGDRLVGRRIVGAGSLIDVGQAESAIVWAPHGRDSFAKLFGLDSDAPIEALRAIPLEGRKGIALAFRRGNVIHVGAAKGDSVLEPEGELAKITGLGSKVGDPAIAVSGDVVLVAWADRATPQDDWQVRWTRMKIGSAAAEAQTFAIPDGGPGGNAMSPSVASLGGGRFLLAWTEGPVSGHQVRAIAAGADGTPAGSAVSISAAGVNAGQPAAVVAADGRGAVAFLVVKGKALEVHATPISCPGAPR